MYRTAQNSIFVHLVNGRNVAGGERVIIHRRSRWVGLDVRHRSAVGAYSRVSHAHKQLSGSSPTNGESVANMPPSLWPVYASQARYPVAADPPSQARLYRDSGRERTKRYQYYLRHRWNEVAQFRSTTYPIIIRTVFIGDYLYCCVHLAHASMRVINLASALCDLCGGGYQ